MAKLSPGFGSTESGSFGLDPVHEKLSTRPATAPPVLVRIRLPVPPVSATVELNGWTSADLWGRMSHGSITVSGPPAIVTYPSNSTVCSSEPVPPLEPPFSNHVGRNAAFTVSLMVNVLEPFAGIVTVGGVVIVTAEPISLA